jgi:uncharacterized alpha-E superfamily protein
MLSRVGNSLYWMVRYIERADNLSRLIDVNGHLLLDHERMDSERLQGFWRPIILSAGDDELFSELYSEASSQAVIQFLTSDRRNPNSIVSCVAQARENARMVRDQLAEELWEELNSLYLYVNSSEAESILSYDPAKFYAMVRRATYTFNGIAGASTARDEGWEFMDLGRHLERADKTTRFLDVINFFPKSENAINEDGTFQWAAILRSCGAMGAYRAVNRAVPSPESVVDFLVYNRDFPRSVRYAVDRIDRALHRISGSPRGTYANAAEQFSGRLLADLSYGSASDFIEQGLHESLDKLQSEFNQIGEEMFRTYVLLPDSITERPPIPATSMSSVVAWQMAQQQQ